MPVETSDGGGGDILLIGASRGLGLAMAAEFLERDWSVVATVRGQGPMELHELAEAHPGRIDVEVLDINDPDQILALRDRLSTRRFDILFVNAGVASADRRQSVAATPTDEILHVFVTNALSPMRVIEGLEDLVQPDGLIGVMSSGQGSVSNNERGGNDVYRGSKAALNQFMRCYAARQIDTPRSLLLMAPGWIRTELGGPAATFSVEESIPKVVDVVFSQMGKPGLRYLDRDGREVPW